MLRYLIMGYLFLAVLMVLFFSAYALKKTRIRYMGYFSAFSFAISVYCLGYLLELGSYSLESMVFWNQIQYLALPFFPPLWLIVALMYTKRISSLTLVTAAVLLGIPVMTFFVRLTNPLHHWFYTSMELQQAAGFPILHLGKGPWYVVHSAYLLLTLVVITLVFVKEYRIRFPHRKWQAVLLILSSVFPFIGLVLILVDFKGWGLDYAALMMPISLLLIKVAILRYDFLEVRSLARAEIFENSADGMLLLDPGNWIMDYNLAVVAFFQAQGITLRDGPMEQVFQSDAELLRAFGKQDLLEFQGKNRKIYEIRTREIGRDMGGGRAVLKTIADITEKKAIQASLEKMATIDDLSQINNRRHFMTLANAEFARACRYCESFAVLMIDVDHFKRVNDRYGHAVGDTVIRTLGKLLQTKFRETDIVGRLGGEEFSVLLVKSSLEDARAAAEIFRQIVAETTIVHDEASVQVTVSIGVSAFVPSAETFDRILTCADEALYASKISGRNRVSEKVWDEKVCQSQ